MHRTTKDGIYNLTRASGFVALSYMESVNTMLNLRKTVQKVDSEEWQDRSRV